jgi:anti-sigma factor RsiW
MDDHPFATWDATYVLGALPPEDRHTYEQHLRDCPRCSKAVSKLVGLPGLLSRVTIDVDGRISDDDFVDEDPPATLLPALLNSVRHERNRWRGATAAACVLAAACLVAISVWVFGSSPSTPTKPTPKGTEMTAVGAQAISAQINLTDVAWGTKIEVHCEYPAPGEYPSAVSFQLVVIGRNTQTQQVAAWRGIPGTTPTIAAATDLSTVDISRIEVRDAEGQPVLTLQR